MPNSQFYSDIQYARLIAAVHVFGVRPVGYFREQSSKKAIELRKARKSITNAQLKKAVRVYMGKLSRKVFSELDHHADSVVTKDINNACELAGVTPPKSFDCNFESLVMSGERVIASKGHSKSISIATDVLNDYFDRMNKVVAGMPKKKMAKINIKAN
jgi:hypothetical protein